MSVLPPSTAVYLPSAEGGEAASGRSRGLDLRASRRALRRRLQAPQSPWLDQEVSRRMAERLGVIRQPPARVLDWSCAPASPDPALRAALQPVQWGQVWPAGGDLPAPLAAPWWRQAWRQVRGAGQAAVPVPQDEVARGGWDLVWSVMALPLVDDPVALLRQWHRALVPGGFLMFATLGPGSLASLRGLYQRLGWGPAMAPLVDMHDLGDMLVEAGFADPVMDQETLTLTFSRPQDLMAELRGLGANLDPGRHAGLRTPRWLDRWQQALLALGSVAPQGRIPLELELVYGHAFRGPDRGPAVSAEARIGLEDMTAMLRRRPPG
ncbi:methyltransferase domain-containing protein [Ideonella livida]|uniref:Biotin synthase n=1 Tax=Ideonella livida TaxID=2707176 RepID=A0A7C9PI76_9BURK|nr:methyltransferase domain-containing protein [Ideonella livida]NDY92556.1 biotin synthase [Ideonella livida]